MSKPELGRVSRTLSLGRDSAICLLILATKGGFDIFGSQKRKACFRYVVVALQFEFRETLWPVFLPETRPEDNRTMATTGKVTMGEQPPPYPQPAGTPFHNPGYAVGPPQPMHMGYNPAPTTVVINQSPHHHGPPAHHHATTVIVHRHGVNHCLHFLISLFFFPWIFVWIFLCIAEG